ncbi:MAG TPA: tetratricopeptide repeat protein [Pyrinomonadaceae bacterium]|nr:tetratricopeptide repeat protein [Pyrinomonadaceae bacterium]
MPETPITSKAGQEGIISACLKSARQYGKEGLHEQAIDMLKAASNLEPDNTEVLITMAAAYYEIERYGDALQLLQRAHHLDPSEPNAVAGLGDVFVMTGKWDDAIEQMETLYQLDNCRALNLFKTVFASFNNHLLERLIQAGNRYHARQFSD